LLPGDVPETQVSQTPPHTPTTSTSSSPSNVLKRRRLSQPFAPDESEEEDMISTPFAGPAKKKKKFPSFKEVEQEDSEELDEVEALPRDALPHYSDLIEKWKADPPEANIMIDRITMTGNLREVTAAGVEMMSASFDSMGIIPSEKFIVRKLNPEEKQLGMLFLHVVISINIHLITADDADEYECIDGNHRLVALRERNFHGTWTCFIVRSETPEEGIRKLLNNLFAI
jgi:hypothetical protein